MSYKLMTERHMEKLSAEFAARLDRLPPEQRVRAIVLLDTGSTGGAKWQRQTPAERKAAVEATRKATEQAIGAIDTILQRFGGRRQAEQSDALGSIPVEATAAGIAALAASEWIKAILEDQPIYPGAR